MMLKLRRNYYLAVCITIAFFMTRVKDCDGKKDLASNTTVCGGVIENRKQGIIESPNYPIRYPSDITCEWLIQSVHKNDVVNINFVDVQLETSPYCLFDYIEVKTVKDNSARRYCDNTVQQITSKSNSVYIRFVSDTSHQRAGFRIAYAIVSKPATTGLPVISIAYQENKVPTIWPTTSPVSLRATLGSSTPKDITSGITTKTVSTPSLLPYVSLLPRIYQASSTALHSDLSTARTFVRTPSKKPAGFQQANPPCDDSLLTNKVKSRQGESLPSCSSSRYIIQF
ncbi:uncharacterized protein LOC143453013 [Clavelina lepadiformis]|uniref:uncharacterized protein LOC143453013 n=1 Tax=Clavelina lepadiformis TaxID=159417 RepID=UPI0040433357